MVDGNITQPTPVGKHLQDPGVLLKKKTEVHEFWTFPLVSLLYFGFSQVEPLQMVLLKHRLPKKSMFYQLKSSKTRNFGQHQILPQGPQPRPLAPPPPPRLWRPTLRVLQQEEWSAIASAPKTIKNRR
jgi:hypothetical protein